jgi:CheY-like chemotaxis protein
MLATMPLRVLIADDSRDTVDSTAVLLELDGHKVYRAYDGPEAVFLATEEQPDVAILDITMPRLSGIEVCRMIRATPWGRNTPIAAVTGWTHERARQQAKENGFDFFFMKPLDLEMLTDWLGKLERQQQTE